ncbi:type IV secretory system conjugative DNA transfer family protein [Chthonobacter rhizosphaerae]|uniref:type IV secretory system conjugative DNA transfer family protein n=1 Tax=Chthonobacter rhizosphaerae TaxID=2735553 RepID=UPI0015EF4DD4|nr:type IV secretory system conjugative DNA transfer family protein [Chthonobacter rhizosphaerae]
MGFDPETERYTFDGAKLPTYEKGMVFLGQDRDEQRVVGVHTDTGVVISALPRSGKGAAYLIPNIITEPRNVVCIDIKGENTTRCWKPRSHAGQKFRALDAFKLADIPDRFRARFNPLDLIDPTAKDVIEKLYMLSDGMVVTHDPKAEHWDGGARTILAGLIAFVRVAYRREYQNLKTVRMLLMQSGEAWDQTVDKMAMDDSCGGIIQSAAATIRQAGKEFEHFLSAARENTKWLDSKVMQDALAESDFDLTELKTGKLDLFLVIPRGYLDLHGKFLRLFVRMALNVMQETDGGRCLFALDEVHALGRMNELVVAAGLNPSAGVRLMLVLHDTSQLETIYGEKDARTILTCCDVQVYFAMGKEVAETVSTMIGPVHPDELGLETPQKGGPDYYPVPGAPPKRPLPPDPRMQPVQGQAPSVPRMPPSYVTRSLMEQAAHVPAAPQMMPTVVNGREKLMPALLNAWGQAQYASQLEAAAAARLAIDYLEKERQTHHTNAMAAYQDRMEELRRDHERAMAHYKLQTDWDRKDYETRKVEFEDRVAAIRHGYEVAKADYDFKVRLADNDFTNAKSKLESRLRHAGLPRMTPQALHTLTAAEPGKCARYAVVRTNLGMSIVQVVPYWEGMDGLDRVDEWWDAVVKEEAENPSSKIEGVFADEILFARMRQKVREDRKARAEAERLRAEKAEKRQKAQAAKKRREEEAARERQQAAERERQRRLQALREAVDIDLLVSAYPALVDNEFLFLLSIEQQMEYWEKIGRREEIAFAHRAKPTGFDEAQRKQAALLQDEVIARRRREAKQAADAKRLSSRAQALLRKFLPKRA